MKAFKLYHIEALGRPVGTLPFRLVENASNKPKRVRERARSNEKQEFVLSTTIFDLFPNWKDAINLDKAEKAFAKRRKKDLVDSIDFDKIELPVDDINLDTLSKSAAIEVKGIPEVIGEFILDLDGERVQEFLEGTSLSRIKNIQEQAEKAILTQYRNGIDSGINPRKFARELRKNIGLNNPQTETLQRYEQQLIEEGLPQKQINKLVEKRRAKMLKYRSEMIARTETTRASSFGVRESGRQLIDQGTFEKDEVFKEWVSIIDNRTTESCISRDGLEVPINEEYPDPSGQFDAVEGPPGHVGCRGDEVINIKPKKRKK